MFDGRPGTHQCAIFRCNEALADHFIEESEQLVVVSGCIEQTDRLIVDAKLRPSENFAKFVHRAEAAGQGNESVAQVRHQRLAFVHAFDDVQLRETAVRDLFTRKRSRDDTDDLAACLERRIRDNAHESDTAAAVDNSDISLHDFARDVCRDLDVTRAVSGVCAAENSQPPLDHARAFGGVCARACRTARA